MSAVAHELFDNSINVEIQNHPTWLGRISGLKAEKMLRGKKPYVYVIRAGENNEDNISDYYVSFVLPDFSIRHQPFVIILTPEGWHYENSVGAGPFVDTSINDVVHLMMHCDKKQCNPLINFGKK